MHLPRAENVGCFLSSKLEFSFVLVALETRSTTYKIADRHQRYKETTSHNLGQNKMQRQTPIPPPQIKDEAARRAKTRHFPILDLGGKEGGSSFSIYFVQDCSFLMG